MGWCLVVIIGLPFFVLRRRLYLELVIRSTSRSGGGCIRERVNCLCLCLACVLCCRYDCLLNVVLDFHVFDFCIELRIEKVTESYFLFANCVNVHLLSDFLRRYFGLIRRVTKSATICQPPPPSSSSKRFRTRNRTQIVKILNFLGLPKSNYSLTV